MPATRDGPAASRRPELHRKYLEALVSGDGERADALVADAQRRGWSAEQIYLHVLAPSQAEIGTRWQARRLSVADEHLATEITLGQMERLRGRRVPPPTPTGHAIVACVQGEGHSIAARMVADFLLIDGWTVDFLGASTPTADLVDLAARRRPDVVALSVTQARLLAAVGAAARALRRLSAPARILAGGAAFRGRAELAAKVGVDAVAADALSGMREARRLLGSVSTAPPTGDDYFERLGQRVQEIRSGKGWTQQQLAETAGLDRTYISGLENGKQNPTVGALLRLARALDVALDRLVLQSS
jgi:MerR family transcriptional regulator, light-induced transcriptional regulator